LNRRVVITGIGCVTPYGIGQKHFLDALQSGKTAIAKWEELEKHNYACHVCSRPPEISQEEKQKYFTDLTIKFLKHKGVLYGTIAGLDAWRDAELEANEDTDWDSGAVFGMGSSAQDPMIHKQIDLVNAGQVRMLGSTFVEQVMNSGVSAHLSGFLGLGNHVTSNSSACSTGSEAVIMGFERIRSGQAERMVCGGCDGYNYDGWSGFDAMRVLCRDSNNDPTRASRPMSEDASGFVPGAGAGALLVESLESAQKRGAKIYAEILGAGLNSGGQRSGGSMTKPNGEGVRKCMGMAIDQAHIKPEQIDLIAGHLTSTVGDVLEVQNWQRALGLKGKDFPYINSTKSLIGHCLGAAGAIELVGVMLQIQNSFIHPSLNTENLHPDIADIVARDKIPLKKVDKEVNVVAKSSFGFGDVNSCLILQRWNNQNI